MAPAESLLRNGRPPIVVGHRGASKAAPENTMAAFLASWQSGAPWIETDVQPTSDGVPVLIHDDAVDRTTNGTGPVRSFTADDLAALDAGSTHSPAFAGLTIPRLTDLLAEVTGDRRVLLEIKGKHTTEQLRTIVTAIDDAGAASRIVLQSFEVPVLERLHSLLPHEPLGLLAAQIGDDLIADCARLGAVTYNPSVRDVLQQPDMVTTAHRADIAVIPWTSDDEAEWARLTEIGVDGIFTNTPAELLAWQQRQAGR